MIIRAAENRVFRRIHDGFIMGNEIVLGMDYSTGVERQDLPEYYEEIMPPDAPQPPPMTDLGVVIPEIYLWVFPENRFILDEYEIPLQQVTEGDAVDIAYFMWPEFRQHLDNGNNEYLKRALMPIWDYVAEQIDNHNFVQL
jgi:hypothetical protein